MIHIFHIFVKVTGWLPQKIVFRTKIFYQNKKVQGRKIKGPAILVSNHTTLFDFAIFMFVFLCRTLRYQMAELLFRGKFMGIFVRCLGGIYVDRDAHDYDCLLTSERILKKGGVVGVFPEGRIPTPKDVIRPLPFHPGVVQLALMTGVPIIPLFTNGCYFTLKRAKVMIGEPIMVADWYDETLDTKENLERITIRLRESIIELERLMHEQDNYGKK